MVWLLFAIAFVSGGPAKVGHAVFTSKEACEASQAALTAQLVKDGVQEGSVTCTPIKIGKFT